MIAKTYVKRRNDVKMIDIGDPKASFEFESLFKYYLFSTGEYITNEPLSKQHQ